MEVLVEHDYDAQETDELTIRRGDRLTNVSQSVEGWYQGTLGNKTGLFPDNFVKIVSKPNVFVFEETPSVQLRPKKAGEKRLRVLFSYAAEQDDELSLAVGDTIDFISEVEDGWFKGSLNGQVGIFPSNFVSDSDEAPASTNGVATKGLKRSVSRTDEGEFKKDAPPPDVVPEDDKKIVEEEPAPELPPKPVRELARCFYPYQAQNEDELTLNEGDIVTIISKNCEDDGWWRGELRGKNGLFPDNFVKVLSPKEASAYRTGTHQPQPLQQQSQSNKSPPKIFSQARNSTASNNIGAEISPPKAETVTDGSSSSKPTPETKSKSSTPTKVEAKESFKSRGESMSSGFGSKLGNIFGIGSKKDSSSSESPATSSAVEAEPVNDFSSVLRTESTKLNHPTATRAKPPRRRPPSTLIPRDGESDITNGFGHSLDTSSEFSTSMQNGSSSNSFNSPTAAPASFTSGLTNVSSGSIDSVSNTPSRLGLSPASVNGTTPSPSSIGGKQVKRPPWMEELELKQKKGQTTSPVNVTPPTTLPPPMTSSTSAPPNASPPTAYVRETSTDSAPAIVTPTSATPPVSAARAPPLPAKPTVADRISMHNSVGSVPSPVSTVSNVSAVSSRFVPGRKAPTATPVATNHSTASITMSSHVITNNNNKSNSTDSLNNSGSEDKPSSKRNSFIKSENVSYEEYAKLKDRVQYLETELDTVKKQLKLLMEREFSKGHIV